MNRNRLAVAVVVTLFAVLTAPVSADPVAEWTIESEVASFQIGEPIALDLMLQIGDTPLITESSALDTAFLWGTLIVVQLLPADRTEDVVPDASTISPPAPGMWVERDGQSVLVMPAVELAANSITTFSIANLLRSHPMFAPGEYRISSLLAIPIYEETFLDEKYADTPLVALDDVPFLIALSEELEIDITEPEGLSEEDLSRLSAARTDLALAGDAEAAAAGFLELLATTESEYIRACCHYWIGEAYQRFASYDEAVAAYETTVTNASVSPFASHAERRLVEIGILREERGL